MQDTTIALVQMQSKFGQIDENMSTIARFVKEAAENKVDIICFPEMCIPGYSRALLTGLAIEIEQKSIVRNLGELAKENNIVIITGIVESNGGNNPFIAQVVAYPDGSIDKYRKAHLGKSEQPYFTPGNEFKVFSTPNNSFGIQICWDTHFPEMSAILSLKGCEIIFAPHASPTIVGDRRNIWLKYLPARAYDNTVFMAACNLIGDDGQGHSFCGGAMVIDPKGNVIAEDFKGQESVLIAQLEANKINKIRQQNSNTMANSFYLRARRPELYHELVR